MELEVHLLDAGQALATLGPVVIRLIVTARTEITDFERIRAQLDRVLERSTNGAVWIVVHHGAPILEGHVRRQGGRMFRPYGERLVVSYAMLGLGFWASAATAATLALAQLIGIRSPIETNLERSALNLCTELVGVDPNRLIATHDLLFERISSAAAG